MTADGLADKSHKQARTHRDADGDDHKNSIHNEHNAPEPDQRQNKLLTTTYVTHVPSYYEDHVALISQNIIIQLSPVLQWYIDLM